MDLISYKEKEGEKRTRQGPRLLHDRVWVRSRRNLRRDGQWSRMKTGTWGTGVTGRVFKRGGDGQSRWLLIRDLKDRVMPIEFNITEFWVIFTQVFHWNGRAGRPSALSWRIKWKGRSWKITFCPTFLRLDMFDTWNNFRIVKSNFLFKRNIDSPSPKEF